MSVEDDASAAVREDSDPFLAAFDPVFLIGRSVERRDEADLFRSTNYQRLFALDPASDIPMALHWMLFNNIPEETREDGHAALMEPFPILPFPRRMWAGGEIAWRAPLPRAVPLVKTSTIVSAAVKSGASGDFLLAALAHVVSSGGYALIEERQDIVFLPPAMRPGIARPRTLDFTPAWIEDRSFDEVTLFRYSALTLNGHRIHYDRSYAETVEHYSGLVVQGPLLAATLMQASARQFRHPAPSRFSYRAFAPVFAKESVRLVGSRSGRDEEMLAVIGPDDDVRMSAVITLVRPEATLA